MSDSANGTRMSRLGRWHLGRTQVAVPLHVTPRAQRATVLLVMVVLVVGVAVAWGVGAS